MWIIKAIDPDENYTKKELRVHLEKDIKGAESELRLMCPGCDIVVEQPMPWTKERAEAEIAEKAKRLGIPNPLKKETKSKKTKKKE